eukprot:scaffold1672_cov75-Phaeocystis_antarctica.AAC.1
MGAPVTVVRLGHRFAPPPAPWSPSPDLNLASSAQTRLSGWRCPQRMAVHRLDGADRTPPELQTPATRGLKLAHKYKSARREKAHVENGGGYTPPTNTQPLAYELHGRWPQGQARATGFVRQSACAASPGGA